MYAWTRIRHPPRARVSSAAYLQNEHAERVDVRSLRLGARSCRYRQGQGAILIFEQQLRGRELDGPASPDIARGRAVIFGLVHSRCEAEIGEQSLAVVCDENVLL